MIVSLAQPRANLTRARQRWMRKHSWLVAVLLSCGLVHAQDEVEHGIRGRLIVSPELLQKTYPMPEARKAAFTTSAISRRPVRAAKPIEEPAPPLTVMVEGDSIRDENAVVQTVLLSGMRFEPSGFVMARPVQFQIENRQSLKLTFEDDKGTVLGSAAPGQTVAVKLPKGSHLLRVKEWPYVTASVRVLERGRQVKVDAAGEIPMFSIPSGDYMLSFFLGAEPLRVQPLNVPDRSLLYIDASISGTGVVDVAIKDAAMRVAVPVGSKIPEEQAAP